MKRSQKIVWKLDIFSDSWKSKSIHYLSFGEHLASILDQKLSKHILLNLNSVTRENKKLEKYISNRNYRDIWRYMIDGSSDVDVSAIEVFFAAIYINKQKQIIEMIKIEILQKGESGTRMTFDKEWVLGERI